MAMLTPGQLAALQNLARKQAGQEVDWVNIADARSLTDAFAYYARPLLGDDLPAYARLSPLPMEPFVGSRQE